MTLAELTARFWLGTGAKYRASALLAGADWNISAALALSRYGISLAGKRSPAEVISVFRGRWFWIPDPVWQAWDVVLPPERLLAAGGDDCDGWAMLHAQALDAALGAACWRTRIVSYLADPWRASHHFAAIRDPRGYVWAVQPQPTRAQPADLNLVSGPYPTWRSAADSIASSYGVRVVWGDHRSPCWTDPETL